MDIGLDIVAKEKGRESTKIHPLGTMNVCLKCSI